MDETTKRIIKKIKETSVSSLTTMSSVIANLPKLAFPFDFSLSDLKIMDDDYPRPKIEYVTSDYEVYIIYYPGFEDDKRCALYCVISFLLVIYSKPQYLGGEFSYDVLGDYDDLESFFKDRKKPNKIVAQGIANILPMFGLNLDLL